MYVCICSQQAGKVVKMTWLTGRKWGGDRGRQANKGRGNRACQRFLGFPSTFDSCVMIISFGLFFRGCDAFFFMTPRIVYVDLMLI